MFYLFWISIGAMVAGFLGFLVILVIGEYSLDFTVFLMVAGAIGFYLAVPYYTSGEWW
jgi:hypothetical protein